MSMRLQKALDFTLPHEGGTNYHVHDRGGLTKFGICQKQYPDLDIASLTLEQATEIYRKDYWDVCRCDRLPAPLDIVVFDTAVNCGAHSAAIWLQKTLGTVKVDGNIGPRTVSALSLEPAYKLVTGVIGYRLRRYVKLIQRRPAQRSFIVGWSSRCSDLLLHVV